MKTFTHEQVQQILQSREEAPDDDREGLSAHLSGCAQCRSYAALVAELGREVPRMYTTSLLSSQEIQRKVLASSPQLRRQSMLILITRGTRMAFGLGVTLALALIIILISPRLLPENSGIKPTLTPIAGLNPSLAPPFDGMPKPGESILYTVREGDNFISIAQKFSLKPETILWANPDPLADNPANIKPGLVLRIPSTDGLYYRWKAGDQIETIASRYGIAPSDILDWTENAAQTGLAGKANLQPGMLLFIPGGKMPLQPAPTLPAASTPTPAGYAGDLDVSALLQILPLVPGTRWSYSSEYYSQADNDPNTLLHAVTAIDERVIDIDNQPPYYFAHIQRNISLVSADPGWNLTEGLGLGNLDFWYVVVGGRVYSSPERPDSANLQLDRLFEELDFPLAAGMSWCPNKIQKGSLTPVAETPVPCASAGARTVLAKESYTTPAGTFTPCYRMSDYYNSGGPVQVFCDGVGIVAETYDHGGTRFGSSKALIQFNRGSISPTPTPLLTATPAAASTPTPIVPETTLQISAAATWGKGRISESEYSPDGKRLGVVTTVGIYLYDAESLKQLEFIPAVSHWPSVAFSPDWSLLAIGLGTDIKLMRLADKTVAGHVETNPGSITRLLFSPDGHYLAGLVSPPGEEVYTQILNVWEIPDGKLLGSWKTQRGPSFAFTPDSQSIYVWYPITTGAGTQLWQISSGTALPVENDIFPSPVTMGPDGNLVLSTDSTPGQINTQIGSARYRIMVWSQGGFSGTLFYYQDGSLIIGLSNDGQAKVWRRKDGVFMRSINISAAQPQLMAISGQTMVLLAWDGLIFYNLSTGQIEQRLQDHLGAIHQAAISPQNTRVAALFDDNDPEHISLAVWSYPDGKLMYRLPNAGALNIAWSPTGDRLALAGWDGKIRILKSSDGSAVQTLSGHPQQVQSVAWSPDGTGLASSSFSVKVWRAEDGALQADLSGSGQWIDKLYFSQDGKLLVGSDTDGKVIVWQMSDMKKTNEIPLSASGVSSLTAIGPDGNVLAVAEKTRVWFYHLDEKQPFQQLPVLAADAIALQISPNSRWLACAMADGSIQLWQISSGVLIQTIKSDMGVVSNLDFSMDNKLLLAASADGTIRFWDVQK